MKTCPVCKSNVFADMPTCFGCMHIFKEEVQPVVIEEPRVISSTRPRLPDEPGYVADDPTTHFQEFDFRIPKGCRLVFTFEQSVDEYVEEFERLKKATVVAAS